MRVAVRCPAVLFLPGLLFGGLLFGGALAACAVHPPNVGGSAGDGVADEDDTAACGTCTLYDCQDASDPEVTTEPDCEDAASDQECDDWEFDPGCRR